MWGHGIKGALPSPLPPLQKCWRGQVGRMSTRGTPVHCHWPTTEPTTEPTGLCMCPWQHQWWTWRPVHISFYHLSCLRGIFFFLFKMGSSFGYRVDFLSQLNELSRKKLRLWWSLITLSHVKYKCSRSSQSLGCYMLGLKIGLLIPEFYYMRYYLRWVTHHLKCGILSIIWQSCVWSGLCIKFLYEVVGQRWSTCPKLI